VADWGRGRGEVSGYYRIYIFIVNIEQGKYCVILPTGEKVNF